MPFLPKLGFRQWMFLAVGLFFMAAYPIYTNYQRGLAITHYQRHKDLIAGKSWFYNPWQYRILCPFLVEGAFRAYKATVDRAFPVARYYKPAPLGDMTGKNEQTKKLLADLQDPDFLIYTALFVLFRFAEHLAIFWLAYRYYQRFVHNRWLIGLGLGLAAWAMGNAMNDSDLTFHTYMDVVFYLCLGLLVTSKRELDWWLVPLSVASALNRETGLLIPALYFLARSSFGPGWRVRLPAARVWLIAGLSGGLFVAILLAIRYIYGYVPPTQWRVPTGLPMIKLNLFSGISVKSYFEIFGVLGIFPLMVLYGFNRVDARLRLLFWALVPAWLFVHWWSVVAYQGRLYLVPMLLVILPAALQLIERAGGRPGSLPAHQPQQG
jgi:hypothetical protein